MKKIYTMLFMFLCFTSGCATTGAVFLPIPDQSSLTPTDPDAIELIELEDLKQPFAILGEYCLNQEKAYMDSRPNLLEEGITQIKQKAAAQGAQALLMVVHIAQTHERSPYKQPFGGVYSARVSIRALAISFGSKDELAHSDLNKDGRPDQWTYVHQGKRYYEFVDEDFDGIVDRTRRFIYDPKARPDVDLDYVPEAAPTDELTGEKVETSVQIVNPQGIWTEYLDRNRDGVVDVESSTYLRRSGKTLVFEIQYL